MNNWQSLIWYVCEGDNPVIISEFLYKHKYFRETYTIFDMQLFYERGNSIE